MGGIIAFPLILVTLMIPVLWFSFAKGKVPKMWVGREKNQGGLGQNRYSVLSHSCPLHFRHQKSPTTAVKELISSNYFCGEAPLPSLVRSHWTWPWHHTASSCVILLGELDTCRYLEMANVLKWLIGDVEYPGLDSLVVDCQSSALPLLFCVSFHSMT